MTEEAIKHKISDWYTVDSPKGITELAKQLLEQHEAEMVEFAEFCRQHDVILNDAIPNTKRTTDLLTLFKNRNK